MRRLILFVAFIAAFFTSAYAIIDSYTIDRDKLPQEAQEMIKEYFPKAKIGMIKIDRHLLKKPDYDVRFVNGTTIEFKNSGKWKKVDCKTREVPEGLIPKTIKRHVAKNYPDVKVVSITKKNSGYEIGLSDAVLLKYDLLGIFKGVKMQDE